ncbi:beta-ketoacyl synthase N-terminal-like domain-containing protein [Streptomyces roseicoloratus]|uniref:beta-ketoacyl synthase N-terminal-like domain-containing protein n=1 Tax=Streptomyces roseicoloratus TaxID=2508722 RepID=UPI001009AFAA|nr:polyketide synthase [Streptomyces roseicoloratus]
MSDGTRDDAIAIVGMAGRFPGAPGTAELWRLLVEGREAVREFSAEELRAAGVPQERSAAANYVTRGAALEDADLFDAAFFGYTQRDAKLMDPQHRVFLTCAWEALEDAGTPPGAEYGPIGVFAGSSLSSYLLANVLRSGEFADAALTYPVLLGNDKDFLATRVSYKLDLRGPSMSVQTACSSSLTAVQLACAALTRGEIKAALAGGVSITFPQTAGYAHQEGGIMSRDGHCRPFDADASGTVKGNGCGVVVLKRLQDALDEGDRVYAVVRGIAVNNDGSDKIGFTAPGTAGQQAVVRAAVAAAGIDPADIGYVEAHGTGTAVGDPLEISSLAAAHAAVGGPAPDCLIGSVKANLGHLDAAAGVTGLIKAALALHHQTVPPQINHARPNAHLNWDKLPYTVSTEAVRFTDAPLKAAAVSAFGLGGTNAHAVLTVPPAPAAPAPAEDGVRHPVVISARTVDALRRLAADLARRISDGPDVPELADLAYTLTAGRALLPVRHGFTAATLDEARAELEALAAGAAADATPLTWQGPARRKVTLPGQPLDPQRYWIEPDAPRAAEPAEAAVPAGRETPAADARSVLDRVILIVAQRLDVPELEADADFYDMGGDSLLAVEVVTALAEEFSVDLDFDEFAALRTPEQMAARIHEALTGGEDPQRGLLALREGEGRALHLVHPAGGTNVVYAGLVEHSGSRVPLRALSFPVQDPPATLRELAALYLERVRREQPSGPYRLGGYSFGGNVALEMALQLQAAGEEVETLVLLDSYPPETYVGRHLTDEEFAEAFPLLLDAVGESRLDLAELRDKSFFRIWKHNYDLLKGHYPDRPFRGDMVLLRADEVGGTLDLDTALRMNLVDKSLWQAHVTGAVTEEKVFGDHFSMFEPGERITRLAEAFDSAVAPFDAADAAGDR